MSVRLIVRCLAVAVLLLSAQAANAQTAPNPTASQILSGFPNGGQDMVAQVKALLNADRANLTVIMSFAKTANEDQRKAIGKALGEIAKATSADPGFANQIQQQVVASGLPELAKAYADATGDTSTASTGGGGGGAGGGPTGSGAPTGGANNGSEPAGSTLAANNFTSPTGGPTNGGTGTNGGFTPVSPF
jgi:hypothetical protein